MALGRSARRGPEPTGPGLGPHRINSALFSGPERADRTVCGLTRARPRLAPARRSAVEPGPAGRRGTPGSPGWRRCPSGWPRRTGSTAPSADPVGVRRAICSSAPWCCSAPSSTTSRACGPTRPRSSSRIEASYASQQEALEAATERLGRLQAPGPPDRDPEGQARPARVGAAPGPDDRPVGGGGSGRLRPAGGGAGAGAQGGPGHHRRAAHARHRPAAERVGAGRGPHGPAGRPHQARLLARTEDELEAEGKEARASFEIGLGVLERDLELLDQALPLAGAALDGSRPGPNWEPVRGGRRAGHRRRWSAWARSSTPTCPACPSRRCCRPPAAPGCCSRAASSRAEAVEVVRSVVLRLLAGLPPGAARFSFIDPKGTGRAHRPLPRAWPSTTPSWWPVARSPSTPRSRRTWRELTRHVERVTARHLQGRFASLDELHRATPARSSSPTATWWCSTTPPGSPTGPWACCGPWSSRGPRCGVSVIVVREGSSRGRRVADQGIPGLPVVHAGPDGLAMDVDRAGRWRVEGDASPGADRGRAGRAHAVRADQHRHRRPGPPGPPGAGHPRRGVRPAGPGPASPHPRRRGRHLRSGGSGRARPPGGPAMRPAGWARPWAGPATGPWPACGSTGPSAGAVVLGPARQRGVDARSGAIVDGLTILYPPGELQVLLVGPGRAAARWRCTAAAACPTPGWWPPRPSGSWA